jgi:hypothetical protein
LTNLSEIDAASVTMGTYPIEAGNWAVGKLITDQPLHNTLTITNCNKIRLQHKETEINFEFDTKKLENIDAIIINGFKYIKER